VVVAAADADPTSPDLAFEPRPGRSSPAPSSAFTDHEPDTPEAGANESFSGAANASVPAGSAAVPSAVAEPADWAEGDEGDGRGDGGGDGDDGSSNNWGGWGGGGGGGDDFREPHGESHGRGPPRWLLLLSGAAALGAAAGWVAAGGACGGGNGEGEGEGVPRQPASVSVIIPALNEEACIGLLLRQLSVLEPLPSEVIVSVGDSSDRTAEVAAAHGAQVATGEAGHCLNHRGHSHFTREYTGAP
jgi:hypothetical protein